MSHQCNNWAKTLSIDDANSHGRRRLMPTLERSPEPEGIQLSVCFLHWLWLTYFYLLLLLLLKYRDKKRTRCQDSQTVLKYLQASDLKARTCSDLWKVYFYYYYYYGYSAGLSVRLQFTLDTVLSISSLKLWILWQRKLWNGELDHFFGPMLSLHGYTRHTNYECRHILGKTSRYWLPTGSV